MTSKRAPSAQAEGLFIFQPPFLEYIYIGWYDNLRSKLLPGFPVYGLCVHFLLPRGKLTTFGHLYALFRLLYLLVTVLHICSYCATASLQSSSLFVVGWTMPCFPVLFRCIVLWCILFLLVLTWLFRMRYYRCIGIICCLFACYITAIIVSEVGAALFQAGASYWSVVTWHKQSFMSEIMGYYR